MALESEWEFRRFRRPTRRMLKPFIFVEPCFSSLSLSFPSFCFFSFFFAQDEKLTYSPMFFI